MLVRKTYCRICEAQCGLAVEVEDGQVRSIRGDADHPVSKGYACVKGLQLGALHTDPDRVDHPMKRVDGRWQRISWEQAVREIGERVRALRKAHGDRCVGLYQGNPTYFSFQNTLFSTAFVEALGSPNLFASHSVDLNNKFEVSTAMYGSSLVHPVPDLDRVRFLMCLGTNPLISQMSVLQVVDPVAKLKAIEARGGRVVLVDPRRTETAAKVGEHQPIRPGTDAFLLLGMLHVVAGSVDREAVERHADGLDALLALAGDWPPERVAPLTGISAERIRELAEAYASADGAALYMSTGVNMGPFGSVAYWVLQALNLVSGNVDRSGGLRVPRGAFDALRISGWLGLAQFDAHRTLVAGWHRVAGAFPAAALAEEITAEHPDRIRALFVSAGNPVHSVPGALPGALDQLDLLVCIDIYPSETAAHADYLLPATDMLERSDFPTSHMVLQHVPHAQFTPAVVQPLHERRPEWEIFSELAMACGASPLGVTACNALPWLNRVLQRLPGDWRVTPDVVLGVLLRLGGQTTLSELKALPEGVLLAETEPGSFLGKRVPGGRVQLFPERLATDLPRLEAWRPPEDGRLALIGRRQRKTHNSWMHNVPTLRQPDGNTALLHPADAEARGIVDGGEVEVGFEERSLRLPVRVTEDVARGVVVVPHGWGHRTAGTSRSSELAGENVNRILPVRLEPVSGQAVLLAHRVEVRPVPEGPQSPRA